MNEFLERIWLDNPVKNYLAVALVILFILVLKKYISGWLAALLFKGVNRIWTGIDKKSFTSLVVKPLGFFLLIFVSIAALHRLKFPEALDAEVYKYTVRDIIHCIATTILIVSFIGLLYSGVSPASTVKPS